jgi:hypothetical protein
MVARDSILMDRYDARNLLDRIEVWVECFVFFLWLLKLSSRKVTLLAAVGYILSSTKSDMGS